MSNAPKTADVPEAAFALNARGQFFIAVADPAFVQSDMIVAEPADHGEGFALHAVLHQARHALGCVSARMASVLQNCSEVLVAGLLPDGKVYEMMIPVKINGKSRRRI